MTKMQKRIVFGSLLLAVMAGILILDGYLDHQAGMAPRSLDATTWSPEHHGAFARRFPAIPIAAVVLGLVLVGWLEYGDLIRRAGHATLQRMGLVLVALLMLQPLFHTLISTAASAALQRTGQPPWYMMMWYLLMGLIPLFALMLIFAAQMVRARLTHPLKRIGSTLLGVVWLGVGGAAILLLRMTSSTSVLVIFLAAAKFTDIGAYFTGSFIGKHKMIPWLSPGKSWEGLVGGLATSAGISVLLAWLLLEGKQPPLWTWAIFGPVVGLAGQFGDLCESLLKRAAGAKDSGSLVPEFGGVLDMLDSVLLSAPVAIVVLATMRIFLPV